MVGAPQRMAIRYVLEKRTLDYFEDWDGSDPQPTTLDYVAAWIQDGQTLRDLTQSVSAEMGKEIGRSRIVAYLHATFGEAATDDRLAEARAHASHSLVEQALDIVDAPAADSTAVAQAASRARARQWTAERYNPSKFGQSKGVSVSVSIGSLHLDALRAAPVSLAHVANPPLLTASDNTVDAEIVS